MCAASPAADPELRSAWHPLPATPPASDHVRSPYPFSSDVTSVGMHVLASPLHSAPHFPTMALHLRALQSDTRESHPHPVPLLRFPPTVLLPMAPPRSISILFSVRVRVERPSCCCHVVFLRRAIVLCFRDGTGAGVVPGQKSVSRSSTWEPAAPLLHPCIAVTTRKPPACRWGTARVGQRHRTLASWYCGGDAGDCACAAPVRSCGPEPGAKKVRGGRWRRRGGGLGEVLCGGHRVLLT